MRYVNVRVLLLISLFLLLTFHYFQHAQAISYAKIEFGSNATWDAAIADQNAGATIPFGKAQTVCLTQQAPVSCPQGATLYDYAGAGWFADLTSIPSAQWVWAPGVLSSNQRRIDESCNSFLHQTCQTYPASMWVTP